MAGKERGGEMGRGVIVPAVLNTYHGVSIGVTGQEKAIRCWDKLNQDRMERRQTRQQKTVQGEKEEGTNPREEEDLI